MRILDDEVEYVGFEVGMDTQQRPGLDGSSSDSDDGMAMNFARSRIATTHRLTAFADEREQQFVAHVPGIFYLLTIDDTWIQENMMAKQLGYERSGGYSLMLGT